MLIADREDIHRRSLLLRDRGRTSSDKMSCGAQAAYKSRMTSMQTAPALAQLERTDELVEQKRQTFKWYRQRLGDVEGLSMNHEASRVEHT